MLRRTIISAVAVPLIASGVCLAEDGVKGKVQVGDTTVKGQVHVDDKQANPAGANYQRLSQFMDRDVHNQAGKEIADIKDVVLDGKGNRVSYVVVSYGGFMNMGDKLFAIPWSAFDIRGTGDQTKVHLTLSEQQLKNGPGFNQDKWPDVASKDFRSQVDTYYGNQNKKAEADKKQGPALQDQKLTGQKEEGLIWARRASSFIGADVHNKVNEDIGDISDLVVDTKTGKIQYAVLSFGGVMGIGDKLFAVPIDALGSKADDNKLILDASKERLQKAPGFDKDQWPDFANAGFRKGVDDFFRGDNANAREQAQVKTPAD